jgi:hypothetical protein
MSKTDSRDIGLKTAARDTSLKDRRQRHQSERHTPRIQPGDTPKYKHFFIMECY